MYRYFFIYKPYGMLSQFSKETPEQSTLADLGPFPSDVYPVGRLDKDSEGLLLLTNDKALNNRLLNPKYQHRRTYWVEVEKVPDEKAIRQLCEGVTIRVNKKDYPTLPAEVRLLEEVPQLPERNPPVRFRKNIPTGWLEMTLTEGKNRQVRRMCAKVGYPTLRLVRVRIEKLMLEDLQPGESRELDKKALYSLLKLD